MANTDLSIFGKLPMDCVNIIITFVYQLKYNDSVKVIKKHLNAFIPLSVLDIPYKQKFQYLKLFMYNNHITQWDFINKGMSNRFINRLFDIHKVNVSREGGYYLRDTVGDDYDIVKHKIYKGNQINCSLCKGIVCYDTFEDYDNFEIMCDACDEAFDTDFDTDFDD